MPTSFGLALPDSTMPLPPLLRLLAPPLSLLLLSACGGGGGDAGGNPDSDSANYLPLGAGDRWVYEVTDRSHPAASPGEEFYFVAGTRQLDGVQVTEVRFRDTYFGNDGPSSFFAKTGNYEQVLDPATSTLPAAVHRLTWFKLPLQAGEPYLATQLQDVDSGLDYDGDGQNERFALSVVVTVGEAEAVDVPAGHFAEARKVHTLRRETYTYTRHGDVVETVIAEDLWLVAGVGIVKRRIDTTHWGYTETRDLALKAYRVGGVRSESVLPAVEEVTPAAGTTTNRYPYLTVTFDESIDISSGRNAGFVLRNAAGAPVPGHVAWSDRQMSFVPDSNVASGTYTATLQAGVRDLLGNATTSAHTWSFDVDATPPQVVAVTPAGGSTGVGTSARIAIVFSEDMGPVYSGGGYISVSGLARNQYSLEADGNRFLLTTYSLAPGTSYDVTVNAGQDLYGNGLATPYTFSFTTAPELFETARSFTTGSRGEAVAVGDVNGDGRRDVVMTQWDSSPSQGGLHVFLQQADGSLAVPTSIPLGSAPGGSWVGVPTSVAVGDMDHDGDNDIVLGREHAGVEVFKRSAGGDWGSGGLMTSPRGSHVRLGDLNGDGRLDIAATSSQLGGVTVWRQAADGSFTATTHDDDYHSVVDLEVGDLNHDGRDDIVLLRDYVTEYRVVSLLQDADGGLSAPRFNGLGSYNYSGGIGLGDLNGDGRNDVVVTQSGKIVVLHQQADGTLLAAAPVVSASSTSLDAIEVADMTGDGRADVILSHAGGYSIGVHRQNADGTLGFESRSTAPHTSYNRHRVALGDINGDGHADVVLAGYDGLGVFYNTGN